MTHCLNLQICFSSNEELRQQLLAIMDIIDNEAEDAEVSGLNNEYRFLKQKVYNTNVQVYIYRLELGQYSLRRDVFPEDSGFVDLKTDEERLKYLPEYLSTSHFLYNTIYYLLIKICKLSQQSQS